MTTPWPSLYEYAMAHPCPTCRAAAGRECNAPLKQAEQLRVEGDLLWRLHSTRQARGAHHRRQDIGAAPWAGDRVPGHRYDTLGSAA